MPAELVRGIYANQLSQVSNDLETIIDFSMIVPINVEVDDEDVVSLDADHTVVARLIVPKPLFIEFILGFISRNPDVLNAFLAKTMDAPSEPDENQ